MLERYIKFELLNGLTETTVKKYKTDIEGFIRYAKEKEGAKNIEELSEEQMKRILKLYINKLEKEKYKPSTINGKVVIINKFLKFIGIEVKGKGVKTQKKVYIDNVITEGEYIRLIEQCKNYRDKAIIITLANTGIRVSELLSLTVDNIKSIKDHTILIKGKNKYREVFFSTKVISILNKYIEEHRMQTDDRALFTGKQGALQRQAINKILRKYAKKGHVKKNKAHPHSLRHFFGKRLAEQGVSLDVIQIYLGHENITTTAIYTKRSKSELLGTLEREFVA